MYVSTSARLRDRIARLGVLTVAFFFLKGMAWLVAGWFLVRGAT